MAAPFFSEKRMRQQSERFQRKKRRGGKKQKAGLEALADDPAVQELLAIIGADLELMSPEDRATTLNTALRMFDGSASEKEILDELHALDYKDTPVSIEKFLDDPYYLGGLLCDEKGESSLYPTWRTELLDFFDPTNQYEEWILGGAIGVGKCQREGTLIPTSRGLLPIETIYHKHRRGEKLHVLSEVGYRPVTSVHDEGATDTVRVTTSLGYANEGRPNHRVRVLENDEIVWKRLDALRTGDVVLIHRGAQREAGGPTALSEAEAELLGAFTGDGHFAGGSAHITVGFEDDVYLSHLMSLCRQAGIRHADHWWKRHDVTACYRLALYAPTRLRWTQHGAHTGAANKEIPKGILQASRRHLAAFLRGLFDTDGGVYTKAFILEFATVSETLSYQVQCALLEFGIVSSRRFKDNDHAGCWTVRLIGRTGKKRFAEHIGFSHPRKAELLRKHLARTPKTWRTNENHDVIPNAASLVRQAWDGLKGRVATRKPYRHVYAARHGKLNLSYNALDKMVEIGGVGHLPLTLQVLYEQRYFLDRIEDTQRSRARCYDLTVQGNPSYVSGGFISHNTTIAAIAVVYLIYLVSMLRNPHRFYSLMPTMLMVFGIYSVTITQAETSAASKIRFFLENVPYFKKEFPVVKRIKKLTKFVRNERIQMLVGSRQFHALGLDFFVFLLDEANFFETRKSLKEAEEELIAAMEIYNAARTRIASRFLLRGGGNPGAVFMISSKGSRFAVLEEHIQNNKDKIAEGKIKLSEYAIWEVKPSRLYVKPRFRVEIGDESRPSRILSAESTVIDPSKVIEVPGEYFDDFRLDTERALRDLAGVATVGVSAFMKDREAIRRCVTTELKHPFAKPSVVLDYRSRLNLEDWFKPELLFNVRDSRYVPLHHPNAARFAHMDFAADEDCAGLAIGHVGEMRTVRRMREDGTDYDEQLPVVWIDLMLRIMPPRNSSIGLDKIRRFVVNLRDMGLPIVGVSADGWQSKSTLQILATSEPPFETQKISVDKNDEPYSHLRRAIMEGRFVMYQHDIAIREMINLIHDLDHNKVDHPPRNPDGTPGSKDVADCLAGVVVQCLANPGRVTGVSHAVMVSGERPDPLASEIDPSIMDEIERQLYPRPFKRGQS